MYLSHYRLLQWYIRTLALYITTDAWFDFLEISCRIILVEPCSVMLTMWRNRTIIAYVSDSNLFSSLSGAFVPHVPHKHNWTILCFTSKHRKLQWTVSTVWDSTSKTHNLTWIAKIAARKSSDAKDINSVEMNWVAFSHEVTIRTFYTLDFFTWNR